MLEGAFHTAGALQKQHLLCKLKICLYWTGEAWTFCQSSHKQEKHNKTVYMQSISGNHGVVLQWMCCLCRAASPGAGAAGPGAARVATCAHQVRQGEGESRDEECNTLKGDGILTLLCSHSHTARLAGVNALLSSILRHGHAVPIAPPLSWHNFPSLRAQTTTQCSDCHQLISGVYVKALEAPYTRSSLRSIVADALCALHVQFGVPG